ncbi:MAG TPA: hypothetical protein VHW09_29350 [Bryobacteraceae bacterium]|nr:hypothetical protein [Bryobacteraceae bacterium]
MNAVFAGQVFRCQRGTEAAVDIPAEYFQRLLLDLLVQLAVGRPAAQAVHDGPVPFALQPVQQPANMPFGLADLLGGLPLCNQPLPCFLQRDQTVAVLLRHEKCS